MLEKQSSPVTATALQVGSTRENRQHKSTHRPERAALTTWTHHTSLHHLPQSCSSAGDISQAAESSDLSFPSFPSWPFPAIAKQSCKTRGVAQLPPVPIRGCSGRIKTCSLCRCTQRLPLACPGLEDHQALHWDGVTHQSK